MRCRLPSRSLHPTTANSCRLRHLVLSHVRRSGSAGVLLSHLPQVISERRCLIIEGRTALRGSGVLFRGGLFPLSEDGVGIDYVLGAANHRLLRENEALERPEVRRKWR